MMSRARIHSGASLRRQQGMTLIIAIVMLFMITMATVSSFHMSKTSLDIVGNMQFQKEAVEGSTAAIQEALSTTRMFTSPNAVFLNPCSGPNTRCYDFDEDGTNDLTVALTPAPTCVQAQPVPNAAIFNLGLNVDCVTQVNQNIFAIQGAVTGNSLCSNSVWEINAVATATATNATIRVVEGAAVLVNTANVLGSCPGAFTGN